KGSGRRANIRVRVLVDEDGKVLEAAVREGDPAGLGFNEAALEAAKKTRFQAATRDEIPGKMWTELIFQFVEESLRRAGRSVGQHPTVADILRHSATERPPACSSSGERLERRVI